MSAEMGNVSDEPGINAERTISSFVDAWNRHDHVAMSGCWIEDGDLKDPFGRHARGRAEIGDMLARFHAKEMAASTVRLKVVGFRNLTVDVALADTEGVVHNVVAPNGGRFDLRHHLAIVLLRTTEGWRFAAVRAILPPMWG